MLIVRISSPVSSVRRARGFTLVEMVVAIAVMAFLMMAVVPGVGDWIRNVRVRSTAESIASGVNEARMEAVRRNQTVSFWLVNSPGVLGQLDASCVRSASSASWIVSFDDPSGLCDVAPSKTVTPRVVASKSAGSAGQDVTIAGLDIGGASASSVAFNGYGQPVTGPGGASIATIDVTSASSGARRLRIAISTGGDVRMCDRDVSSPDPRRC